MDTVTHALAGYVVARTGLVQDTGKWGIFAGVAAAVFPDADGILGLFAGTEFYLQHHRGLTNSLLMIIPFSLIFAWILVKLSGLRRFRVFALIWAVEMLVHTFLDLVTSYGTMILSPLSDRRFALDWVFIIDLFFTAILLIPMIAMWIWRKWAGTLARTAAAAAALYVALCAGNHFWALSIAKAYAQEKGLKVGTVASIPQPLSPFHWGNYIVTDEQIHQGLVNLIGTRERTISSDGNLFERAWANYQPMESLKYRDWVRFEESVWVKRAMRLEGVRMFLWFARFPIARYEGMMNGHHRVTLFDLRFGGIEGRRPFLYEVGFGRDGEVAYQRFQRDLDREE